MTNVEEIDSFPVVIGHTSQITASVFGGVYLKCNLKNLNPEIFLENTIQGDER